MTAYIVYRIALCLHLEIYLTLSMIILNETIRADLIVFIALFADLGTIAIAYDNAPFFFLFFYFFYFFLTSITVRLGVQNPM